MVEMKKKQMQSGMHRMVLVSEHPGERVNSGSGN